MESFRIGTVAYLLGVPRALIRNAVQKGRIRATKDEAGVWQIQATEVERERRFLERKERGRDLSRYKS